MQLTDLIFSRLRIQGHKLTRGRKYIINILSQTKSPISPVELLRFLHERNIKLNKTTIYRELQFLKTQNIIREIQFGERNKRYELAVSNHHHHIVCKNCKNVEEINSDELENNLSLLEKEIFRQKNFQQINHSLEFFGLCPKCQ